MKEQQINRALLYKKVDIGFVWWYIQKNQDAMQMMEKEPTAEKKTEKEMYLTLTGDAEELKQK